jgi:hypothetical protein
MERKKNEVMMKKKGNNNNNKPPKKGLTKNKKFQENDLTMKILHYLRQFHDVNLSFSYYMKILQSFTHCIINDRIFNNVKVLHFCYAPFI